jgi:aerobic-type carbon monoxide dehydrogenase small subunit (CoxS/CutS family)
MDATISTTINGKAHRLITDPKRSLLEVLREDLQLTGAKFGCGETRCGACSVLIDGERAFSCTTHISAVEGKKITTIEGLCEGEQLHPVQQAFLDEGAYQCGYCTGGMIINAVALLNEHPHPSNEQIVEQMNTNLCRCSGYAKITKAVQRAADASQAAGGGK